MTESNQLDQIAIENFQTYLRFPTVHPDPDYSKAVEWLLERGAELGLACRTFDLAPGNPFVLMQWVGSRPELRAIMLNSHMDVVPVDASKWTRPPFDACLEEDGKIYARGAQDMKCVGMQQLEAVRRLQTKGYKQPKRTVYLCFTPDEELGGVKGMQLFTQSQSQPLVFADLNVGLFLDEGLACGGKDRVTAYYAERFQAWMTVTFKGKAGHGSRFIDQTAAAKFHAFLDRIMQFRASEERCLVNSKGRLTLGDVSTVNLTIIEGGLQHNIVPNQLKAGFDVRLTPTLSLARWKVMLDQWACECGASEGDIEFEWVTPNQMEPPLTTKPDLVNDPVWSLLDQVCRQHGVQLDLEVFLGGTDARFARLAHLHANKKTSPSRPILAIGFSPMPNTPVLLHDHDEYLHKDVFLFGCRLYTDLLQAYCDLEVDL